MNKRMLMLLVAVAQWAFNPFVFAQDDAEDEEVFELSPFQVDTSNDSGYRAENTLAGSRLNTNLADVASSVSVFTEAFIEDLGIQSIDELADYTTNMYVNYNEDRFGGANQTSDRESTTAVNVIQQVSIRGVDATKGIDYFRSITPSDGYRAGRYDESRGPNSILFGLSGAGGIVNTTSIGASTQRDSGRLKITHEDTGGFRTEFRVNRVLIEDKLGLTVAGVDAENEEWQVGTYDDTERIFGAVTFKANDRLTLRGNYESGTKTISNQSRSPALDFGGITLYDWTNYYTANGLDLDELVIVPNNNNNEDSSDPLNAGFPDELFTQRVNNAFNLVNPANRYIYVVNDGGFFENSGAMVLRSYGDNRQSAPPDANWENENPGTGNRYRIDMTDVFPRAINTDGPGSYKNWDFENYSFFADYKVTENFFVNLSHNYQVTDVTAYNIGGFGFSLYADINYTRGLDFSGIESGGENDGSGGYRNPGFGVNPYAGQWYLESNWRRDLRHIDLEATRLSASYELDTERLGTHQFAALFSTTEEFDTRFNQQLGMLGRPFNGHWNNNANRVEVRTYFDWDDPINNPESFHIGSWEHLVGQTVMLDVRELATETPVFQEEEVEIGWTNRIPGNENRAGTQTTDTHQFAMVNYWLDRSLVTTFGLRKDESDLRQYYNPWATRENINVNPLDPNQENVMTEEELLYGPMPSYDTPELDDQFVFDGETSVAGVVYHINDQFRLMANFSDSVGFPNFTRTLIPDGNPAPPPEAKGLDYGLGFRLADNRISGRLVYYEVDETGVLVGSRNTGRYQNTVETIQGGLIEQGLMTEAEVFALDEQEFYTLNWNGDTTDKTSRGVELSINANITDNWRLTFKASKTDRIVTNYQKGLEAHLGLLPDPEGEAEWDQLINPFEQVDTVTGVNGDGENIVESLWTLTNPAGLDPDGVYAQFIDHAANITAATEDPFDSPANFQTSGGFANGSRQMMAEMWDMIADINNARIANGKRWGLRPYNANVFTAYDFSEGALRGLTIGGGVSWKDNMIIGEDEETREVWYSRQLWDTNAMIRYKWRNGFGPFEGPITLQLNVRNVLDDQDIIPVGYNPVRGPRWELPYDRGLAFARYDVPQPRSWRLSLTYDF